MGLRAHPRPSSRHNMFRGGEDLPRECALDCKVGNDDCILGICAPCLEQLPRQARLHHAGGRHHDAWPDPLEIPRSAELPHVPELERVRSLQN